MFKVLVVVAAVAVGVAFGLAVLRQLPDIQRYQRMRSM